MICLFKALKIKIKISMGNKESLPENKVKRYTNFEHEDVDNWSKAFYSIFPNEHFSKKDLVRELKIYFPNGNVMPFSEHLFRAFSKKEKIGFHEFIKIYSYLIFGDTNQKLELIFKLYDSDNDNKLSRNDIIIVSKDLLLMLRELYEPNFDIEDVVDLLFKEIDKDFIDFKSFKEMNNDKNKAFEMLFCAFDKE